MAEIIRGKIVLPGEKASKGKKGEEISEEDLQRDLEIFEDRSRLLAMTKTGWPTQTK